jgi:anti-sigma-K factor RskA
MALSEREQELLAAHALGVADSADAAEIARLLERADPEVEELLADLRLAGTAMAATAPRQAPRPELRAQILASLGPSRAGVAGAHPSGPAAPRRAAGLPWWLSLAAAVALVALLLDDMKLRRQREDLRSQEASLSASLDKARAELSRRELVSRVMESEDVRVLFLGGHGPQPAARAKVFWSEKAKRGVLLGGQLAALPEEKQYQLWVFDKGKPVDAGVFDVDAQGRALFESKDLSAIARAENFAVTVEPRGGVPQPTGPIVLVGATG